jgi:HK97 family phage major capsid protein/HK97 family phage prohead protease
VLTHAHAVLHVKAVDAEARTITGIATTPTPDRQRHSFDPFGASYTNPLPLLLHHDQALPVGRVTLQRATATGIAFTATLPSILEPGPLKNRVDEAWQSIKAGLLMGVSVGFRILDAVPGRKGDVLNLTKTEICELSLVTVPANMDCTITTVKSLDAQYLAAMGQTDPPRAGGTTTRKPIMTIPETIQNFENTRAAKVARLTAIMDEAKGATLDANQQEEYDGIALDVKDIDGHLVRYHDLEKMQTLTPITPVTSIKAAGDLRGGVIRVTPNVDPGIKFARFVIAKIASRYENTDAVSYAEKRWADSTPEVALALKAAVVAGSTTDATWAKPLVNPAITSDFLPLLRAATIIGKIDGLRKVPFNVNVPAQTAGGVVSWVGELKPKPVSAMAFSMENLGFNKVAAIVVLSQELVRFSNPSAEAVVRDSLVKDIAAYLDAQFINPAVAAVAGVNPASITNGAPTAAATTNPLADILGLINHFAAANIPVDGLTFLLSPANALALSFRTNLDGSPEFPGIGINGGTYNGLQFITSNTLTTNVVALAPQYILMADDGGVTIDASTEASLQMDSAPASPPDATTVLASMFQMNAVAVRAERYISWKRIGTNTVKYLTATAWPSPTGGTMAAAEANGRTKHA